MWKKIFIFIVIDQITKLVFWSRDFFLPKAGPPQVGLLHIHQVKNSGLIFSLDFGLYINLVVIGLALIFFLYYFYKNGFVHTWSGQIIFALILAGAISNIFDRLYLGYVRDFLDIGWGFTFNLADVMIFIGLVWVLFTQNHEENIRH